MTEKRPASTGQALQLAAHVADHREGEAFAALFLGLLGGGESFECVAEHLDLGRAVTRERRRRQATTEQYYPSGLMKAASLHPSLTP